MKDFQEYLEEKRKCQEELKGKQHKIDVNKNGKIDAEDLAKLRSEAKDDTKDDGTGVDEVDTSDYKVDKHGKKYKAHKIVFNKGEDDGKNNIGEEMTDTQMKKREDYVKGMKKSYKGFVDKYGKDRAKSVMYATATKMAMKEEEQIDELSRDTLLSYANKVSLDSQKHSKDPTRRSPEKANRSVSGYAKAHNRLEKPVKEGWEDMKAMVNKAGEKKKVSTLTKHDVKKTATGTVYTKQRDADGMSKEFKRDSEQTKRGRGRPKKNQFAEAVEFILSLDEQQYNELMEEGFDTFFEAYSEVVESADK